MIGITTAITIGADNTNTEATGKTAFGSRSDQVQSTSLGAFDAMLSETFPTKEWHHLVSTIDRRSGAYDRVIQSELANIHVTGSCT